MILNFLLWAIIGLVLTIFTFDEKRIKRFSNGQKMLFIIFGGPIVWMIFIYFFIKACRDMWNE